jgi:hypothetical protein
LCGGLLVASVIVVWSVAFVNCRIIAVFKGSIELCRIQQLTKVILELLVVSLDRVGRIISKNGEKEK